MDTSKKGHETHPRMIPNIIDEYAAESPSRVYAWVPSSSDPETLFNKITYKELATAVSRACFWLDTALGAESTFAYSGLNDLRYPVLITAAARSGRQILLPSQSLTLDDASTFLERFDCRYILCSESAITLPRDKKLQKARHLFVPEVEEWFGRGEAPGYPHAKTWTNNSLDVFLIVDSTDTIEASKPVSYNHAAIGCFDILERLETHKDRDRLGLTAMSGERVHSSLGFTHTGGSFLNFFFPLYFKYETVFGPVDDQHTADTVRQAVMASVAKGAILTSQVLEEIRHDPGTIFTLQHVKFVTLFSASLKRSVGDYLSKYLKLQSFYGSLEIGAPLSWVIGESYHWEYVSFHPDSGIEMEYREKRLYEAVQIRRPDLSWNQISFQIFPKLDRFCTGHLFSPHERKEGLWKYQGVDEVVTLTGRPDIRIYVAPLERKIEDYWIVKNALIGGTGKSQLFVLIDLIDFAKRGRIDHLTTDPELLKNGETEIVWRGPISNINQDLAAHGVKIEKGKMVMSRKRFLKTSGGGVDRQRTMEYFQEEIDSLFEDCSGGNSFSHELVLRLKDNDDS